MERVLTRCIYHMRDVIARVASIRNKDMVWSQWDISKDSNQLIEGMYDYWQEVAVHATIAVDEISSAIKWLPSQDEAQQLKQDKIRDGAVECLKAGPIAEFICRIAWSTEQPGETPLHTLDQRTPACVRCAGWLPVQPLQRARAVCAVLSPLLLVHHCFLCLVGLVGLWFSVARRTAGRYYVA